MQDEKEIKILDFVILFVKNKKFLLGYTFLFMVLFYLTIFFLIDEQYDATATIVPSQDNSLSGLAGALGGISDLPFDIGEISSNPEIGLYNTILTSRTNAERIIEKYNLWEVFDLDKTVPKEVKYARQQFLNSLSTEENDDGAYIITMRTPDAQLSADIVNDLVDYLNSKIIELKVKKSRENRLFLYDRLVEVREKLRNSEDSLKIFQKKSGLLNPEEQIKGLVSLYSQFEQELIIKQIQKDVLEEILDKNSPQLKNIDLELKYFKNRIEKLQREGKENTIFVPYQSIPNSVVDYYRYFREVEINGTILEFILPLYEQAKLEEQKEIPVIQVIDNAIPPEEKSFPPRALLTLLFGMIVFLVLYSVLLVKQNKNIENSDKLLFIKRNLFKWNVTR